MYAVGVERNPSPVYKINVSREAGDVRSFLADNLLIFVEKCATIVGCERSTTGGGRPRPAVTNRTPAWNDVRERDMLHRAIVGRAFSVEVANNEAYFSATAVHKEKDGTDALDSPKKKNFP